MITFIVALHSTALAKPACLIPMDVIVLLDSSSSAGEVGYQSQKDFVGLLSNGIDMSPAGSRIGVISYGSEARLDVTPEAYDNAVGLQSAVSDLKFLGGSSRIDTAFDLAFNDLFTVSTGARPGVPRVAVLFTAGKETNTSDYETLRFAVEPFKGEGIPVIVVGIGPNADLQRLRVLVDSDELILAAESFEELSDLALNVTLLACKAAGEQTVLLRLYSYNSYSHGLVLFVPQWVHVLYSIRVVLSISYITNTMMLGLAFSLDEPPSLTFSCFRDATLPFEFFFRAIRHVLYLPLHSFSFTRT